MPSSPAAPRVRAQHSNLLLRHRIPASDTGGAGPVGPLLARPPRHPPRPAHALHDLGAGAGGRGGGMLLLSLAGTREPYLPTDAAGRERGWGVSVRVRVGDR